MISHSALQTQVEEYLNEEGYTLLNSGGDFVAANRPVSGVA